MKIINLLTWLKSRSRKKPISVIVLHSTAGKSAESSVHWLRIIGYSYHALVADGTGKARDGEIIKSVPDKRVALHAGVSSGPYGPNVNDYSLGIAFASMDNGYDPITKAQYEAAVDWCATQCLAYKSIEYITTHRVVSPGRKRDPRGPVEGLGPGFDLALFVKDVNEKLAGTAPNKRVVLAWGRHK